MVWCVIAITIFFAVSDVSSCPVVPIKIFIQGASSWLVAIAVLSASPQSLLFLVSSYTPCVLGSSQPLSIPPEPLIQCPELPHGSHPHNTTFHSVVSNFKDAFGLPPHKTSSHWTSPAVVLSTALPCVNSAVSYVMFARINKSEPRLQAPGHHDDGCNINASRSES